jgi:hypothetical protein
MINQLAIVLAALIIAGAIIAAQFVPRYEIAAVMNGVGNPILWRTNARTGDVEICSLLPIGSTADPFEQIAKGARFEVRCSRSFGGEIPKQ